MIVRHIVEISEDIPLLLPITSNDFQLRLYEISNPRPGLTPETALRAVGSGNIVGNFRTNTLLTLFPRYSQRIECV